MNVILAAAAVAENSSNQTDTTFNMVQTLLLSITSIAGSGWVGMVAMGFASLLVLIGSIAGTRYLAKYIKDKTYKNDVDLSNSSAGTEAIEAAKADEAAKQQLQNAMTTIHNELDAIAKKKQEKK